MGRLNIPGVCQKKGSFYRRFRYYDEAGKRKDLYVKLPAPTDPRFAIELDRVNREYATAPESRDTPEPGSFWALATAFRTALAAGWTKKQRKRKKREGQPEKGIKPYSPSTLANYLRYVAMFEDPDFIYENQKTKKRTAVRDLDVKGIRPVHIHELRDGLASTPGKANVWLTVLKLMLTYATERDWRADNPAADIAPLPIGEHEPWPATVLEEAKAEASQMLWLAIATGLCSGQRISDVIRIHHSWLKTGIMSLSQFKTDVDASVPVHPLWREEIDKLPKKAVTVLYDRSGRPFSSEEAIQSQIRRMMKKLGHVDSQGQALYTFHGLRKNACCYLLETGLSDTDVGAILGMTPETVRHYGKRARALTIAQGAAAKMTAVPFSKMGR
ncbi:tyrosine-type recombinase/integrase [Sphingopyxis sp. FD7]|jgi:DNA-binding CsgD family transcriptional regulator|uniref:tyrosine-type recombinase/integrase n=1 Tax=Sphingopyxis sp. FD7 TaxID=1914525 RepID=UPI000DC638B7|nr:tyrosine-type recombinase/integrase [Sphingopyxis sp. FD7]BBB13607.1 hypothetical protein SPYCA_2865 [Sphingopyxis sp. FD7]